MKMTEEFAYNNAKSIVKMLEANDIKTDIVEDKLCYMVMVWHDDRAHAWTEGRWTQYARFYKVL